MTKLSGHEVPAIVSTFLINRPTHTVDLSRLFLQPLVWYLDKAEYVTCSWLLEHTITPFKFQTSAAP
ncbi:MAG: hypothetical protein GY928_11315 [Colwellia sp.]|nr:hypothetical protein [Colwellia sp.]